MKKQNSKSNGSTTKPTPAKKAGKSKAPAKKAPAKAPAKKKGAAKLVDRSAKALVFGHAPTAAVRTLGALNKPRLSFKQVQKAFTDLSGATIRRQMFLGRHGTAGADLSKAEVAKLVKVAVAA